MSVFRDLTPCGRKEGKFLRKHREGVQIELSPGVFVIEPYPSALCPGDSYSFFTHIRIFIGNSIKTVEAYALHLYRYSIKEAMPMLIAIDHGNKLIKVLNHAPFTSGLQETDTPPFGGETLKYQGK